MAFQNDDDDEILPNFEERMNAPKKRGEKKHASNPQEVCHGGKAPTKYRNLQQLHEAY